jgi:hypothetical protein
MKLKFINSSKDEREKEEEEDTVKMTVTEMIIFEFSELLVNIKAKMSLILTKEMMKMTKQD